MKFIVSHPAVTCAIPATTSVAHVRENMNAAYGRLPDAGVAPAHDRGGGAGLMSEWWTYRLTSFLLFSPRTYYRLLELYNLAIWPAQLAGVAIGLAIVALLIGEARPPRTHHRRPAAPPAGCGSHGHFITSATPRSIGRRRGSRLRSHCEALLLVVVGVLAGRLVLQPAKRRAFWIATSIVAISVLGYPLLAPLTGRPWTTAEIFRRGGRPDGDRDRRGCWRWSAGASDGCCWSFRCSGARSRRQRCGRWMHRRASVVVAAALLALWPAVAGTRHDAPDAMR